MDSPLQAMLPQGAVIWTMSELGTHTLSLPYPDRALIAKAKIDELVGIAHLLDHLGEAFHKLLAV